MATVYIVFTKTLKHSDNERLEYVEEPIQASANLDKIKQYIAGSMAARRAGLAAITIETFCSLLQSDESVRRLSYQEWANKATLKINEKYKTNLYWVSIELDAW